MPPVSRRSHNRRRTSQSRQASPRRESKASWTFNPQPSFGVPLSGEAAYLRTFAPKMQINGLQLPERFVRALDDRELSRDVGSWDLRSTDAFGNLLETSFGEVHGTFAAISAATSELPNSFEVDGCYGSENDSEHQPGVIPDIVDFAKIVCFGISGDGSPFCFDYRDGPVPSVIWWDDVYWRRVAPDFDSFVGLIVR